MNLTGGGSSWSTLGDKVSDHVMNVVGKMGFETMTPVQAATIPLFLSNKDVLVEACTGSGKTLSFLVPIIEIVLKKSKESALHKHQVISMVISPTRELASQIYGVLQQFSEGLEGVKTMLLIGGTDIYDDVQKFNKEGGNILIGTPGRLEEFLIRVERNLKIKEFEMLILDEADRLLDMGFNESLNAILEKIPKQRRTGLFSATQSNEVKELARMGMRNPVKVAVAVKQKGSDELSAIPATLENSFMFIEPDEKFDVMCDFVHRNMDNSKIIIYFLTCADVDYFSSLMTQMSQFKDRCKTIFSLHGKVPHERRKFVYDKFCERSNAVLLVTDLAARGLDFPLIDWVIQYDAPQDPKTFVHRIGRTARMGRSGHAMLYLSRTEDTYLEFMRLRHVAMVEVDKPKIEIDYLKQMRRVVMTNRQIMERSIVAYVSYARAYREHTCRYIFLMRNVQWGKLATGYGLLRLPGMPELRYFNKDEWSSGVTLDQINKVPYKDRKREVKRIELLRIALKKKENRERKREKKAEKKKQLLLNALNGIKKEGADDQDDSDSDSEDDSDEEKDFNIDEFENQQDEEEEEEEEEEQKVEQVKQPKLSLKQRKEKAEREAEQKRIDKEKKDQDDMDEVNRDYKDMKKSNKKRKKDDDDDLDALEKEIEDELKKKKVEETTTNKSSSSSSTIKSTTSTTTKSTKKSKKDDKKKYVPKKLFLEDRKKSKTSRQKKSSKRK